MLYVLGKEKDLMLCMTPCAILHGLQPLNMSEDTHARESRFLGNMCVVSSSPGGTQSSAGQKQIKPVAIPRLKPCSLQFYPCHPPAVPAVAETIVSGTEWQKNTIPVFRVCNPHTKARMKQVNGKYKLKWRWYQPSREEKPNRHFVDKGQKSRSPLRAWLGSLCHTLSEEWGGRLSS